MENEFDPQPTDQPDEAAPATEPTKTKMSGARKAAVAVGGVAFALGVLLLGFGVLNYMSDDGDDRAEAPAVLDLGESPLPTPRPTPTPAVVTETPIPGPPLGEQPYQMVIDSISVNAPVQTYGLDENAIPEVPTGDDAADVVVWYDFSARPGTGSNAVFAGHVTWFGPAVFYDLRSMAPGDQIKLIGQDGTELVYGVSSTFQVDAADPDSVQVMWGTETDVLTIITCDGSYADTGDPVFGGEYSHRLVIRADLMSTTAVSAEQPASGG